MPQGDKRGNGWEFYDTAYDGHWDGEELRRGLGQLTDGRVGPDNFKMSYYENDRSQGWVGWRNDTRANKPIEIKFEFDGVREFTCVHIYCNNQFTKDVQVNISIASRCYSLSLTLYMLLYSIFLSVCCQGFLGSQSYVQRWRTQVQRGADHIHVH